MNFAATTESSKTRDIQDQVLEFQHSLGARGSAALQRADAGKKLHERKRFGEVIVGTGIQAGDYVGQCIASREHQDGNIASAIAQLLGHLEAVESGEHHIKENQIEGSVSGKLQGGAAIGREVH